MFHGWDNYFFMLGSAAASLIGLLFVVVTLTQGFDRSQAMRGASIYMTPTAVHFAMVLSVSAVALAPGLGPTTASLIFGFGVLVGFGNAIHTCLGIRGFRPNPDPPHWSDFWYYGAAPAVVYVALGVAVIGLGLKLAWAIPAMAILLLVLLLVGIRNAWDLVTWMAPGSIARAADLAQPPAAPSPPS